MVSRLPPLGDGGVVVWATTQNLLAVGSAFSAVEYQLDVVRCYSYTAWGAEGSLQEDKSEKIPIAVHGR